MIDDYHNQKQIYQEDDMKKLVALLLALVLVFSFVACSPSKDGGDTGKETNTETSTEGGETADVPVIKYMVFKL